MNIVESRETKGILFLQKVITDANKQHKVAGKVKSCSSKKGYAGSKVYYTRNSCFLST